MSFAIVVRDGDERGDCHLEIGGTAFPAAPWHDRPVVILGWWAQNHLAMLKSNAAVTNSFMEGPYEFTVTPGTTGFLTIVLVRRGIDADERLGEHRVDTEDYERALVRAGETAAATAAPGTDRDVLRAVPRRGAPASILSQQWLPSDM